MTGRRALAALLAGTLACGIAACGGDDADPSTAADADAGTGTDADADADADPQSADTTGAGSSECREVDHELGTACVPAEPQRIVTLDSLTVLPTLVELDVPVAGALSVYPAGAPFPTYLDPEATEGIEIVGDMQAPNVEAIAALQPDLIIGALPLVEPIQDELERIAPTVTTRYTFYEPDWLDDVRLVAEAVGAADRIETAIDELDDHVAEVRVALAGAGAGEGDGDGPTLSRIDIFQGAPIYYRFGCTWFGDLLRQVGVTQPEAQAGDDCTPSDHESVLVYPSLEELEVLDADAIVAYQQQTTGDEVGADPLATVAQSPIWSRLDAVRNERVFVLGDAWGLGGSIAAANLILDDLATTVFAR